MTTAVLTNARVVTMVGDGLGVIERGHVEIQGGRVRSVGAGDGPPCDQTLDAGGRVVTPGLIDAHTHACWAGERREEWAMRLRGASYLELLEAGGGIMSTVRAVRAASEDLLTDLLLDRLTLMRAHGTTALEIKSGYGLTTEHELKMLRAIAGASEWWPGQIVPTACIGHAKDPDEADPVTLAVDETLPAIGEAFGGIAVDAYCEASAWSVEECVRLFEAARDRGHAIRVHTDQFNSLGMVDEAIGLGARSVDHLEASDAKTLHRVGGSGMFAVLLPASGFHLDDRYANGRAVLDAGGRVVVATNCNPGSAPCCSLAFAAALAVRRCGLTPTEALRAITVEAAALLGLEGRGVIAEGAHADLVVWNTDDEHAVVHDFGGNLVASVAIGGAFDRALDSA